MTPNGWFNYESTNITPKRPCYRLFLNKRDQNMIPNSIGLFSSNTKEKKLKDPQAMITIFNRLTWRPMAVTALKTNIVSYHQRDSNNKRNSLYPDTNVMSRSFFFIKDILFMTSQKVMISFTSQQLKHLSERDVSKSNIDTTIDSVKFKK